jgi:hypothetical protein
LEANSVKLERTWAWFEHGWGLFARYPLHLLALVLLYALVGVGSVLLSPYAVLIWLLWPYFHAGTFCLLQRIDRGEGPRFADLFKPFGMPGVRLKLFGLALLMAGLYLFLSTASVTMVLGAKFAMESTPGLWDHIGPVIIVLAGLVSLIFFVLIQLATIYAAPLVVLYGLGPAQALSASFRACSRNWQAFLVFVCILGIVVLGLAVLLLFLSWVAIGAIKASDPFAAVGGVGPMLLQPRFLLGGGAVSCLLGVPIVTVVLCTIYASFIELFAEK